MCGIIGIIDPDSSGAGSTSFGPAYQVYRGLMSLQHRGQDAAGILAYDSRLKRFVMEKDLGLVTQVFDQKTVERLTGHMAIGHTRYATAGTDGDRDVQPMITGVPFGFGMAHNGNILNYFSLVDELAAQYGRQMLTSNDLEVMMHYWGLYLLDGAATPNEKTFGFDNIKKAAARLFDTLVGGYAAVTLMADGGLIAFRDPQGIRPLGIGIKETSADNAYCVASETSAMHALGFTYLRDVAAGEVVHIDSAGNMQSAVVAKGKAAAPCMFEWVYFSGADSSIDKHPVYAVRLKLGERLAEKAQAKIKAGEMAPDVVMPVPDTSRPAAITIADTLKLPYREGMIKNRYVARSFILATQEMREAAVEQKLSPVLSEIEGRSIFLIDDSIVRGTTCRKIVDLLKKHGAKEVTLGITCPPIRYACYYGIDFPDPATLIAHERSIEEIEEYLGVEKLIYLDEEDLRIATGMSELCMACLNNKYPTAVTEGARFSKSRQRLRAVGGGKA
ncbi:MAG: amidophosphoribosyltransferase [Alphaproteobacteria bacterium]|nr:amidophosphoribosyltransferase [Alphaproteobacteria bacterium]